MGTVYGVPTLDMQEEFVSFVTNLKTPADLFAINELVRDVPVSKREVVIQQYRRTRRAARLTDPGRPATVAARTPVEKIAASLVHYAEAVLWTDEELNEIANAPAELRPMLEEKKLAEVADLWFAIQTDKERMFWDGLRGTLKLYDQDSDTAYDLSTRIPAANKLATVPASWATTSTDIKSFLEDKRIALMEEGVTEPVLTLAYKTADYIINNDWFSSNLSDRQKDALLSDGSFIEVLGWKIRRYPRSFIHPVTGSATKLVADDEVFMHGMDTKSLHFQGPSPARGQAAVRGRWGKVVNSDDPDVTKQIVGDHTLIFPEFPHASIHLADVTAT